MSKYTVTPVHLSGIKAPFICVDVPPNKDESKEQEAAVEIARSISRLAEFETWRFIPKYNSEKKGKRKVQH